MQQVLVNNYIRKAQSTVVDLFLISRVNSDTIIGVLNKIYNFDWCYEILEIKEFDSEVYATIVLYTPGRIYSTLVTSKSICEININLALTKALKEMYEVINDNGNSNIESQQEIKEVVKEIVKEEENIKTSTLDEIEKEVKSIKTNQYGIREDQIAFMNNFKKNNNIDSDDKFNYYIKTWSDNTGREISTKKELITSGEIAVDEFIKWASIVSIDSSSSINISSPI